MPTMTIELISKASIRLAVGNRSISWNVQDDKTIFSATVTNKFDDQVSKIFGHKS